MDKKESRIFPDGFQNETTPSCINNEPASTGGQVNPHEPLTYTHLDPDSFHCLGLDNTTIANEENVEDVTFDSAEMFQLLASWGFVDLYEYFVNLKLTVNRLKIIDNEDLKEIFANRDFGVKVEFKHKLYQWRKENVNIYSSF